MITLIATGHYEKGICNSVELLKIIEQISPDVIFEEVPPDKFERLYKNELTDSIESKAIKLYLQKNEANHFPVDLEIDSISRDLAISDYGLITHLIEQISEEYQYISSQWEVLPARFGFPFLNSAQCEEFLDHKLFWEAESVARINHKELSKRYQNWLYYHNERENEMIRNIYNHYTQNAYKSALFMVGVEHRKRLMEKIMEHEKISGIHLDWNFNYFG